MSVSAVKFVVISLFCVLTTALVTLLNSSVEAITGEECGSTTLCNLETALSLEAKLDSVKPSITQPNWYKSITVLTYKVETRGSISVDMNEFKAQVDETLNSNEGWIRAGLWFKQVETGADFVVVLAKASEIPSFAPGGCTSYFSCTVGNYVIINQDRWLNATEPWNGAGGNIRDYRHMVINHETGHWLGHHNHATCGGEGQLAPVMQQQSSGLNGCKFNPWPLKSELWIDI